MSNTYMGPKEIVAEIRAKLKEQLPEYKFSVTRENYKSITVAIMSGPIDILINNPENYLQVNHYYLGDRDCDSITKEGIELLIKVREIVFARHWDESDSQTDYFHCNYYGWIHVGKWDKGYVKEVRKVTKKAKKVIEAKPIIERFTKLEIEVKPAIEIETKLVEATVVNRWSILEMV